MKLVEDAGLLLRKAWSIRLSLAGALFAGLEALGGFLPILALPPRLMASLALICAVGAALSRLIAQPKMRGRRD